MTLTLTNSGGDNVEMKFEDSLYLDFLVAGYFKTNDADSFDCPLPNDFCDVGLQGPFTLSAISITLTTVSTRTSPVIPTYRPRDSCQGNACNPYRELAFANGWRMTPSTKPGDFRLRALLVAARHPPGYLAATNTWVESASISAGATICFMGGFS